jgi:hypothetical protein
MEEKKLEITLERTMPVYWAMMWRAIVAGIPAGFIAGLLAGIGCALLGYKGYGATAGGIAGYMVMLPVSFWALKAALNANYKRFTIGLEGATGLLKISMKQMLPVYWAMTWRCIVGGGIGGAVIGAIFGVVFELMEIAGPSRNIAIMVTVWLFYFPLGLWAVKAALNSKYKRFTIAFVSNQKP